MPKQPTEQATVRADAIQPENYLWEQRENDRFPNIAQHLGLLQERRIIAISGGKNSNVKINGSTYQRAEKTEAFGDFSYRFIDISTKGSKTPETYVEVNLPHSNLPKALAESHPGRSGAFSETFPNQLASGSLEIMELFGIRYYRRVAGVGANGGPPWKVVKELTGDPGESPGRGGGVKLPSAGKTKIGINLPIAFTLNQNLEPLKRFTDERQTIKNKGSLLRRATGPRKDIGQVMAQLIPYLASNLGFSGLNLLPASAFAKNVLLKSTAVLGDWQRLKQTQQTRFPDYQEWCHLQGHGDGGDERLGNLVCGSEHCNTEQLAIETGQRTVTHVSKDRFELRTTAYLFHDGGQVVERDYLRDDPAYKTLAIQQFALYRSKGRQPNLSDSGRTAPIVAFIRYKIYRKGADGQSQKCFDHLFEGQGEFFDQHQFNILEKTAQFALRGMEGFLGWYEKQEKALRKAAVASRSPSAAK